MANNADAIDLMNEVERLRAALEDRVKVVAEHRKVIIEQSGRIHAALALLADWHCVDTYEQTLHDAVVTALKGEA